MRAGLRYLLVMASARTIRFDDADAPDKVVIIRDPAAMKVFYDPFRFRIIRSLVAPMPARDLAAHLGTSPQRINHHLRLLEDAGFIRIAAEQRRGKHVERVYGLAARTFRLGRRLDPSPLRGPQQAFVEDLDANIDAIRAEVAEVPWDVKGQVRSMLWTAAPLTAAEAMEFDRKLRALIARTFKPARSRQGRVEHGFLGVMLPVSAPSARDQST